MAVNQYKFTEVHVTIDGFTMDDIPEDSTISIAYDREHITKETDRRDGGIFGVKEGKPGNITIDVMQDSRWVAILSDYRLSNKMIAVTVMDRNKYDSRISLVATHCMIQDPALSFGTDPTARTFVFEAMNMVDEVSPL